MIKNRKNRKPTSALFKDEHQLCLLTVWFLGKDTSASFHFTARNDGGKALGDSHYSQMEKTWNSSGPSQKYPAYQNFTRSTPTAFSVEHLQFQYLAGADSEWLDHLQVGEVVFGVLPKDSYWYSVVVDKCLTWWGIKFQSAVWEGNVLPTTLHQPHLRKCRPQMPQRWHGPYM